MSYFILPVQLIDVQESMMTWTSGYFTELNYTFGYYREMSPLGLRLACLCNGVDVQVPDAPTYLELGFGHGVSINMHAAGSAGRFFGTDFNPFQVVSANQQADASQADIKLFSRSRNLPDVRIFRISTLSPCMVSGAGSLEVQGRPSSISSGESRARAVSLISATTAFPAGLRSSLSVS